MRVRIEGEERIGGFLFDFRAAPDRRTGLSRIIYRLWEEVETTLLAAGVEFIFGLVKEDNPALSIYHRMGATSRGTRTFFSLPVYRRRSVPTDPVIRRPLEATAAYREATARFIDYDLWPILDSPSLLQPLFDRHLRYAIDRQEASVKIWDLTVDYEQIALEGPFVFELLRPPVELLRRLFPLPRIPRRGEPLRTWYLYDLYLPRGTKPLPALLAVANNLALEAGIDFLVFSTSEGEKAATAIGGRGALARLRYHLLIKEYRPVLPRSLL
ncbi:MAG: hypothetical protein GX493_06500 [Firmicutes bacterium]|nr:hypothetical protein [Bacillota bacterium]